MNNILITGAQGAVGSKTVQRILDNGDCPIALVRDRNRKTNPELLSKVEKYGAVVYGDITNRELVRDIVGKYELDYIIHLAAMPIVKICDADPYTAYNVNVMGTLNLLEAARDQLHRDNRLKKFIVMTSDKAFGNSSPPGGYVEETPFQVSDTYCTSKSMQDMLAQSYAKTYGLPICIVRCGNLYGGGDLNLSRLIPGTILRLLKGEEPVLYTDAAEMKREYIHFSDVVDVYMTLLEKGVNGEAYNVGAGVMYKTLDVINKMRDMINPNINIKIVERSFFEIGEQCLNAAKLRKLGWTPKYNLDTGLAEAIDWYSNWQKNR